VMRDKKNRSSYHLSLITYHLFFPITALIHD
jgi:hypothetical protein